MMDDALSPQALNRARWASMAVFFMAGMLYATWGVHIPEVRDKFRLDAGALSVALLAVAIGSVLPMFVCGAWVSRVGAKKGSRIAGLTMITASVLFPFMPFYPLLLLDLAVIGFGLSALDIAMNAEAAVVEQAIGRPIMSSMHGVFSVGGLCGAAIGSALIDWGAPPQLHVVLMGAIGIVALTWALRSYLPATCHSPPAHDMGSSQRWRSRRLWALGSLAFIAMLAEGGVYDWVNIFLRDVMHATPALGAAGYGAFAAGMAVGRLSGDAVRKTLGAQRLMLASAVIALVGVSVALWSGLGAISVCGFLFFGLGLANVMPVLFAASANVANIPAAQGLAHVAGLAYFGLLSGPVLIGAVAQRMNLRCGISVIVACTVVLLVCAPRIIRRLGL
ncbi:MFS transporter [Paraburkholderia bannensis]|uniref:MFS transporter n=1 Tax=Paraburkholderia bannensis TaxID=765414 RepID=UPI002AC34EBC|nr:MFS transporter [Paraburkholderia bannensis]